MSAGRQNVLLLTDGAAVSSSDDNATSSISSSTTTSSTNIIKTLNSPETPAPSTVNHSTDFVTNMVVQVAKISESFTAIAGAVGERAKTTGKEHELNRSKVMHEQQKESLAAQTEQLKITLEAKKEKNNKKYDTKLAAIEADRESRKESHELEKMKLENDRKLEMLTFQYEQKLEQEKNSKKQLEEQLKKEQEKNQKLVVKIKKYKTAHHLQAAQPYSQPSFSGYYQQPPIQPYYQQPPYPIATSQVNTAAINAYYQTDGGIFNPAQPSAAYPLTRESGVQQISNQATPTASNNNLRPNY